MSAHVLLNLLNELGKRDKMRGLPINQTYNSKGMTLKNNEGFQKFLVVAHILKFQILLNYPFIF